MSSFFDLLSGLRSSSKTEREKGTYFERIAKAYLAVDPVQVEEYDGVWSWAEWAKDHGFDGKDVGIDLIAKLRHEDGFAAIQAKFYKPDTRIRKEHIDSFISASGKSPFRRRVVIDTTSGDWSDNAEAMIRGQDIPVVRIGLNDLNDSRIDWGLFAARDEVRLQEKKLLRPHQKDALEAVEKGLASADRGKLIMACGTGKTFTALKIAEHLAGAGKRVLVMVPSLALMSQSIREWISDTDTPIRAFSVCSDSQVGKRRKYADDAAEIEVHDLAFPATTNPKTLADRAKGEMTVIFSTYQSIQTLTKAHEEGLPEFDLIICDEAHRTTGATLSGDDESNFVRVHSDDHVKGKKRLYMTATPRVFGDSAKSKAEEVGAELASMDDSEMFGEVLFQRGFGWAVQNGLLTDYKVIVLAMDEGLVSAGVQNRLKDENSELDLDDATKIIGCYKALTKQDLKTDIAGDPLPMKRALAFCRSIAASKLVESEFSNVVGEYLDEDPVLEHDEGASGDTDRLLYKRDHGRAAVNAIANFCLLTKNTNLSISDRLPEVYFAEIEERHPGTLSSQWIPMDEALWRIENYEDFLTARREILAEEANQRLATLLHGEDLWLASNERHPSKAPSPILGGITSLEEEEELQAVNAWVEELGFKAGEMSFDHADEQSGEQVAIFDLVWPSGIQEGLSEPVALLLNETEQTLALANEAGLRCFTSISAFKAYVESELLGKISATKSQSELGSQIRAQLSHSA